ncbi:MAG: hypothetical protein ACFFCZ_20275 [Promethearchaeota archaeon]
MPNESLELFEQIKKGFQDTIDLGRRATSELNRFKSAASRAATIVAGTGVTSALYAMDAKDYGLRRAVTENLQYNTGMEYGGRAAAKIFPKKAQGIINWTSEIKQLDEAMKALERSSTVVTRSLSNVTKVLRFAAGPVGQTIAIATLAYDQFVDRAIKKYQEFEKVRNQSVQKFEEVARRERQLGFSITGRVDSGARTAYLDYASRAGISTTGLNRLAYLRAAGEAGARGLNVRESDLAIRYGAAIARETGKEVSRAIRDSMREVALAGITRGPESVETRIARKALASGLSLSYRGMPTIGQRWDTYFQERGREISRAYESPYGFNFGDEQRRIISDILSSIPGIRTLNIGRASTGGFERATRGLFAKLLSPVTVPLAESGRAISRGIEIAGQYKDYADIAYGRWAVSHLGNTPYERYMKGRQKENEQILALKSKRIEREKKFQVVDEKLQPWRQSIDDYTNRYLASDAAANLQKIRDENISKRNQIAQLESQLENENLSKAEMIKRRKIISGLRRDIEENNERKSQYDRALKNSGIRSDIAWGMISDRDKLKETLDRNKKRYEKFREKEILKYSQALPERRDFNLFDYIGVYDSSKIQEKRRAGVPQDRAEAEDFLRRAGVPIDANIRTVDQAREVKSIMAQETFFKASEETKERVARTYIESARLSGRYKGIEAVKMLAPQLVKLGEGKNLLREYINIAGPDAINRISDKYNFTGDINEKRRKIIERVEKGDDIQRRNMAYDISEALKGEGAKTFGRLGGATTRAVGEVYRLGQNVEAIRPAEDIISQQIQNRINLGVIAGKRFEETRQFPYLAQRGATLGFLTGEEATRFGVIGREDEMTRNQIKNILAIKERAFQEELEFTKQYTQARMNVIQEHYDRIIKTEQLRLEGKDRRFAPQLQYGQQLFGLAQAGAGAIMGQFTGEDYQRALYRQERGLREQRGFLVMGAAGIRLPPIARFGLALRSQQEQEEDFRRAIARQRLQDQLQIRSVRGTLDALAGEGVGIGQLQQTEGGLSLLTQMFQSTQGAYSRRGINTLPLILGLLGRQRQFAARRLGLQLEERGLRTRMFEDQIRTLEAGGAGLTGRAADLYRAQMAGKYKEAYQYFGSIGDVERFNKFSEKFEKAYSSLPEQMKIAFEDQQKLTNDELLKQTAILDAIRKNTAVLAGIGAEGVEKGGVITGTTAGAATTAGGVGKVSTYRLPIPKAGDLRTQKAIYPVNKSFSRKQLQDIRNKIIQDHKVKGIPLTAERLHTLIEEEKKNIMNERTKYNLSEIDYRAPTGTGELYSRVLARQEGRELTRDEKVMIGYTPEEAMKERYIGGVSHKFPYTPGIHPFDKGSWRHYGGPAFNIAPRTPGSEEYNYEKVKVGLGDLKFEGTTSFPRVWVPGGISVETGASPSQLMKRYGARGVRAAIDISKKSAIAQDLMQTHPELAEKAISQLDKRLGLRRQKDLREQYAQELESLGWKRDTTKFIRPDGSSYSEDVFTKGGKSMFFNQDQLLKAAQIWSSGITDSPSIQDEFKSISPEDKNADTVEKFGQYVKEFGEKNIHITVNERGATTSSSGTGSYGFKQGV